MMSIISSVMWRVLVRPSAIIASSSALARAGHDEPSRRRLDHQCQGRGAGAGFGPWRGRTGKLALAASAAIGADFAGVDIVRGGRRQASGARGQQHARLDRAAIGRPGEHRRCIANALLGSSRTAPTTAADGPYRFAAPANSLNGASTQTIGRAYNDACYQEIEALKPGNVHRFADGHRMTAEQFFESAQVSSRR